MATSQIDALIEELHEARNTLASEDSAFAQTYTREQSTRAALWLGITALGKAINTLALVTVKE
jgi:hypothetical protein